MMLNVHNLHVEVNGVEILKGVNLQVKAGEVHAVMGPNGSGKSTLANSLAGHPLYSVTGGMAVFAGENLLDMLPEERARAGLLLCFQQPVEIAGVRLDHFMRASFNAIRKGRGEEEVDVLAFDRLVKNKGQAMGMDPSLLKRSVNDGFSGGEKKRSEILQMTVLEPKLAILDEPDSGLDVDALKTVAQGINQLRSLETAVILITHYQRILDYVIPDAVHVLADGRIARTGAKELALEVEAKGYDNIKVSRADTQPSV
jgi:Fe-S cluster assembly ATP-binding protein